MANTWICHHVGSVICIWNTNYFSDIYKKYISHAYLFIMSEIGFLSLVQYWLYLIGLNSDLMSL